VEIPYIGGEEEEFHSIPVIEELVSPTQKGSFVESATSCVSPKSEISVEDLSKPIVVIQGGPSSSNQSSESSAQSQNHNQNQLTSPTRGNTQINMAGVDNTLRLPEFQGFRSEDLEQQLFVFETIWAAKNVQDEVVNIALLATTFRGHALVWYMKLQSIMST
jgi:hypothetical protein